MNISPRAATQLHNFDPNDVARILDHLREYPAHDGVQVIEVRASAHFRCFVGRHRDGSLVLISVLESKPRAP